MIKNTKKLLRLSGFFVGIDVCYRVLNSMKKFLSFCKNLLEIGFGIWQTFCFLLINRFKLIKVGFSLIERVFSDLYFSFQLFNEFFFNGYFHLIIFRKQLKLFIFLLYQCNIFINCLCLFINIFSLRFYFILDWVGLLNFIH